MTKMMRRMMTMRLLISKIKPQSRNFMEAREVSSECPLRKVYFLLQAPFATVKLPCPLKNEVPALKPHLVCPCPPCTFISISVK